jgi:hypothetical protein
MIDGLYGFLSNVNKSSVKVFITTINSSVAEASNCTIKYFSEDSLFFMFLTLDIREMNDIRLISRPIHAPNHELQDTDTDKHLTKVVSERIFVELLDIREESVYSRGYEPISFLLAYSSTLKLVNYIFLYGAREFFMLNGDSSW